ncbi:unnamed protein product [Caenorhabditis sp. 36 PRJEB53466]|nr:unnamed protein product [Caenorhabditis sp. 36 PRJEB53466]
MVSTEPKEPPSRREIMLRELMMMSCDIMTVATRSFQISEEEDTDFFTLVVHKLFDLIEGWVQDGRKEEEARDFTLLWKNVKWTTKMSFRTGDSNGMVPGTSTDDTNPSIMKFSLNYLKSELGPLHMRMIEDENSRKHVHCAHMCQHMHHRHRHVHNHPNYNPRPNTRNVHDEKREAKALQLFETLVRRNKLRAIEQPTPSDFPPPIIRTNCRHVTLKMVSPKPVEPEEEKRPKMTVKKERKKKRGETVADRLLASARLMEQMRIAEAAATAKKQKKPSETVKEQSTEPAEGPKKLTMSEKVGKATHEIDDLSALEWETSSEQSGL